MALDLFIALMAANVLVLATIIGSNVAFGTLNGGVIGEPSHEVTVEPKEEPVPKTAPAPVTEPVKEPVPG